MLNHPLKPDAIAGLVNTERIRQGLSIRMAAKVAGVPAGTLQGWLSGKHVPTPALRPNFERLVAALGLSEQIDLDWADLGDALTTLRESAPPYVGLPRAPCSWPRSPRGLCRRCRGSRRARRCW